MTIGIAFTARGSSAGNTKPPGIQDVALPNGYRRWKLISVAHEAGKLNDIRAVLGNDAAFQASRGARVLFPDGGILVRLAWIYTPSPKTIKHSVTINPLLLGRLRMFRYL